MTAVATAAQRFGKTEQMTFHFRRAMPNAMSAATKAKELFGPGRDPAKGRT